MDLVYPVLVVIIVLGKLLVDKDGARRTGLTFPGKEGLDVKCG